MFGALKELLRIKPVPQVLEFVGAPAQGQLPDGFFRCVIAGRETLGWSGTWQCYEVGHTVSDHGKTITLAGFLEERELKSRTELPLVKLDFARQTSGVHQLGGQNVITTDSFEEFDGEAEYETSDPANPPKGWGRF